MVAYKGVHTAPNVQPGGCQAGLSRDRYQVLSASTARAPATAAAATATAEPAVHAARPDGRASSLMSLIPYGYPSDAPTAHDRYRTPHPPQGTHENGHSG
ncbi:hypothetical protein GCM10010293_14850 [Streptomyces griseoflavus]|nr:hypothetical protein GCM10010293_14850 [Streptomyces griseoflavus]